MLEAMMDGKNEVKELERGKRGRGGRFKNGMYEIWWKCSV